MIEQLFRCLAPLSLKIEWSIGVTSYPLYSPF